MQTIKIFLASSSELKADREQFEIFISRKNSDWVEKGIYLKLIIWEAFLDALSQNSAVENPLWTLNASSFLLFSHWSSQNVFEKLSGSTPRLPVE